ncbi:MAG: BtpA/SgcQ family protein [Ignavibacteria bacterium]|nr:BtpA/SgcQ family protein [Ignavibacteria bacterium]
MKVFNCIKPVIAMIHVDALPGTPKYQGDVQAIINKAKTEAQLYRDCGVESIMIENMHDVPYLNRQVGHEITAIMSVILHEVKNLTKLPLGIQILAGANKNALAAALAAGADYIRGEGFVFAHVADEGTFNSDAGEILRYRKQIGADAIKVFTDIKKKHSSHSITADTDIAETAKAAEFFMSDGVIVTGSATGAEPSTEEISAVKNKVSIPVLSGSGVTIDNIDKYFELCDAFIIGSYFKYNGDWRQTVDPERTSMFMKKMDMLRQ